MVAGGRLSEDCRGDQTLLTERVALRHAAFDGVALTRACSKYGLTGFDCKWLIRPDWPEEPGGQFARKGYGLNTVCAAVGYELKHHDALGDAKPATQILLAATRATG